MKKNLSLYRIRDIAIRKHFNQPPRILLFYFLLFTNLLMSQDLLKREITINLQNVTLKAALNEIEKKGKVSFVYSRSQLPLNQEISIDVTGESLERTLNSFLTPLHIKYEVQESNKHIVLTQQKNVNSTNSLRESNVGVAIGSDQHLNTITGKVIDKSGKPILGVTVLVKGTNVGTTTRC